MVDQPSGLSSFRSFSDKILMNCIFVWSLYHFWKIASAVRCSQFFFREMGALSTFRSGNSALQNTMLAIPHISLISHFYQTIFHCL